MDSFIYLNYLILNGKISAPTPCVTKDMEKELLLSLHENKIWESKDNSWCTYCYENGKRRLIKKKNITALEDAVAESVKQSLGIPTFKECFDMWVAEKLEYREICNGTKDRYYNDYARFVKDSKINDMAITDITEDILRRFCKNAVKDNNLTSKAYSGLRTIIIGTFKYAKSQHLTEISITTFFKDLDISKKAFTRAPKKAQVFDEEEMERIIQYIKSHKTVGRLGVLLAMQTGLREGELSALRFSDIDGKVIHVRREEVKYKSETKGKLVHEIVDHAKTEAGERDLIITPRTLETIEDIREIVPDAEYLMTNPKTHKKMWATSYNNIIYDMCDALRIERRSMHKLRKTYASMLLKAGTDETLVQAQLGHTDIATTRKYYQFCNLGYDKKVAQIENAITY